VTKYQFEAGTAGTSVCAFDPAALPADFDGRIADDPDALMDALKADGCLWWEDTGGDCGYVFHVHVNEDASIDHAVHGRMVNDVTLSSFPVPSGRLWFCGAEFAASDPLKGNRFTPKGGLKKHKGMGTCIELTPGLYSLRIRRFDTTDFDPEISGAKDWANQALNLAVAVVGIAFLVMLFSGIGLLGAALDLLGSRMSPDLGCEAPGTLSDLMLPAAVLAASVVIGGAGVLIVTILGKTESVTARKAREDAARLARPDYVVEIHTAAAIGDVRDPDQETEATSCDAGVQEPV
jgi:hypothetical protein